MSELSEGELEDSEDGSVAEHKYENTKQLHNHENSKQLIYNRTEKKKPDSYKEELDKANQEVQRVTDEKEQLEKAYKQLKKDYKKLEKKITQYEKRDKRSGAKEKAADEEFRPEDDVIKKSGPGAMSTSLSLSWKDGSETAWKPSQSRDTSAKDGERRSRRKRPDEVSMRKKHEHTSSSHHHHHHHHYRGGRSSHTSGRGRGKSYENHSRRGKSYTTSPGRRRSVENGPGGRRSPRSGSSQEKRSSRERSQETCSSRLRKLSLTTLKPAKNLPSMDKNKILPAPRDLATKKVEMVKKVDWRNWTEGIVRASQNSPERTFEKTKIPLKRKADSSTDRKEDNRGAKKTVRKETAVPDEAKRVDGLSKWVNPVRDTSQLKQPPSTFSTENDAVRKKIGNRNPLNLGGPMMAAAVIVPSSPDYNQQERRLSERISNKNDPVLAIGKGMGKTNPLNLGGATPSHPDSPIKAVRQRPNLLKDNQPCAAVPPVEHRPELKCIVTRFFPDPRRLSKPRSPVLELRRCMYKHDTSPQSRVTPVYNVEKVTATPEEPETTPQQFCSQPTLTHKQTRKKSSDETAQTAVAERLVPNVIELRATAFLRQPSDQHHPTGETPAAPSIVRPTTLTSVLMYYRNPALQSLLQLAANMLRKQEPKELSGTPAPRILDTIDESPRSLWVSTSEDGDESKVFKSNLFRDEGGSDEEGSKEDPQIDAAANEGVSAEALANISANSDSLFNPSNISLTSSMNSWLINEESLRKFLTTTACPLLSPIKNGPKVASKDASGSKMTNFPRGKKLFQSPKKA